MSNIKNAIFSMTFKEIEDRKIPISLLNNTKDECGRNVYWYVSSRDLLCLLRAGADMQSMRDKNGTHLLAFVDDSKLLAFFLYITDLLQNESNFSNSSQYIFRKNNSKRKLDEFLSIMQEKITKNLTLIESTFSILNFYKLYSILKDYDKINEYYSLIRYFLQSLFNNKKNNEDFKNSLVNKNDEIKIILSEIFRMIKVNEIYIFSNFNSYLNKFIIYLTDEEKEEEELSIYVKERDNYIETINLIKSSDDENMQKLYKCIMNDTLERKIERILLNDKCDEQREYNYIKEDNTTNRKRL